MFLGKGDSSQLGSEEQETLANLRRMTETGHIVALNPKETEVALRAFSFYGRWESAFTLVTSLRNMFILFSGGILFWWATGGENFVTDFIRKTVEQ